jgi:GntR family histidine utilization transcriptional repressor
MGNPVADPAKTRGDEPLHQRIRSDIERRILSGEWNPGYRIPFEHELMAEYDCARMTVSKALSALTDAGLIERHRRAGSFVRQPAAQSAVVSIPDIQAEIEGRGQTYRYELLSMRRRRASKQDRKRIAAAAGATVLAVQCRHFSDGRPAALEDRLIVLAEVPEAENVDFRTESPGGWLLRHIPWHVAEHQISALNASEEIASLLSIDAGSACLVVDRQTWRVGIAVTAVRIWFPGDLQRLVARFTPLSTTTDAPGADGRR